jgi:acyl phosphate:glycerol-3-phosphate acyltransferase
VSTLGVIASLVIAYLLGATPSSYLLARWMGGIDLREVGSRNLGATNLYRQLGWKAAIPAGLFDLAKGAVPVALAARYGGGPAWWPMVVGLAAVLGHVYSPFVGFKGGKGVATAAGVFLALTPASIGVAAIVWLGLLKVTGYMSVASMMGAAAFAAATPLFYRGQPVLSWVAAATCAFIVFTHRSNVRRLLAGTEARFGKRGPAAG